VTISTGLFILKQIALISACILAAFGQSTATLFGRMRPNVTGRIRTIGSVDRWFDGSPDFGRITSTRFPTGESGSSRQVQFALKVLF